MPDTAKMIESGVRAGKQAAYLYAVGGARATLTAATGTHVRTADVALLGVAELVLAAVAWMLPWRRLPRWSSLLLTLPAFVVIACSEHLGLIPLRANGIPFVIVFAWVGAYHRRWSSLPLVAPAVLAYSLPPYWHGDPFDAKALAVTAVGCVLVAEVIAAAMQTARETRARAERAAEAFRVVAAASTGLHHLDPVRVLDEVVDAVIELGHAGANLAVIDADGTTFRPTYTRGMAMAFRDLSLPVDDGVTGMVRRTGQPVVVEDYQRLPQAIAAIQGSGARSAIAVPVYSGGAIVAVLHASNRKARAFHPEDVEAMRMLATTAGTALDNAHEFAAERESARRHAEAALTDELTGVGNRRFAQQLLDDLAPGDCVVLLDLDHFKQVNDTLGHQGGDLVLRTFAAHLASRLRDGDSVARFGGEEFLVVLQRRGALAAGDIVQRLMESWRQTNAATTFSAGVAVHADGCTSVETVARADGALYAAKAAGRDTFRTRAATPTLTVAR